MIKIPDGYEFAVPVPKKGARCSTCVYLAKSGDRCANKDYAEIHGDAFFTYDGEEYKARRFCCSLWTGED